MKSERPIFWHQGLFLQPQHFQYQEQFLQSLFYPHFKWQHPHFWGAGNLEIREGALAHRSLELEMGEFLFPDGSWAQYPGNALVQPRSFEKDWLEEEKPFTVFLGLRKFNSAGGNTTSVERLEDAGNASSRFICPADPEEVVDLYHPGPPARVKRMYYLLKIFWEGELQGLGDFHVLPLAQLRREGEEIKVSRQFVPPLLALSASPVLKGILKDIRDQVASRCQQLEEYKRPQELDSGALTHYFALRSLSRFIPSLYTLSETPDLHPWMIYGCLRELVGELSTFSPRVNALGELTDGTKLLPAYEHENLWHCFSETRTLIGELLNEIMIGPKQVIRLAREKENLFTARISAEVFDTRNEYYLVIKAGEQEGIAESISRLAKMGSAESLPTLVSRSLPGAPLQHLVSPPPGMPRRSGTHYFRIEKESSRWVEVQKSMSLCFYWQGAPADAAAEIVILRKGG